MSSGSLAWASSIETADMADHSLMRDRGSSDELNYTLLRFAGSDNAEAASGKRG